MRAVSKRALAGFGPLLVAFAMVVAAPNAAWATGITFTPPPGTALPDIAGSFGDVSYNAGTQVLTINSFPQSLKNVAPCGLAGCAIDDGPGGLTPWGFTLTISLAGVTDPMAAAGVQGLSGNYTMQGYFYNPSVPSGAQSWMGTIDQFQWVSGGGGSPDEFRFLGFANPNPFGFGFIGAVVYAQSQGPTVLGDLFGGKYNNNVGNLSTFDYVAQVPEPSTLALLGTGMALALYRRRRTSRG